MLRFIGFVALSICLIAGGLYFGGYMDGEASVNVTSKGRQALNSGVDAVQAGVNSGLDQIKVEEEATTVVK